MYSGQRLWSWLPGEKNGILIRVGVVKDKSLTHLLIKSIPPPFSWVRSTSCMTACKPLARTRWTLSQASLGLWLVSVSRNWFVLLEIGLCFRNLICVFGIWFVFSDIGLCFRKLVCVWPFWATVEMRVLSQRRHSPPLPTPFDNNNNNNDNNSIKQQQQ